MRPADVEFLSGFLKDKSGLVLTAEKTYLLENRLQPLVRSHDLESIDQLVDLLRTGGKAGLDKEIVEAMTTNESFFFRDIKPFDIFRDEVLPKLIKARESKKSMRIWSAAASTGQEPYSLAMLLKEAGNALDGWRIEIVATDLDSEVLIRAKEGIYTQFEVQRGLPMQLLVKYFEKAGDKWQLAEPIRQMVSFREHNLLESAAGLGRFDVIFCRNVLIYFDADTKSTVLEDMSKILAPDGYLFLGGAETVLGVSEHFGPVQGLRGVYAPTSSGAATAFSSAANISGSADQTAAAPAAPAAAPAKPAAAAPAAPAAPAVTPAKPAAATPITPAAPPATSKPAAAGSSASAKAQSA